MNFIKINENLYPAEIKGRVADAEQNSCASKPITLVIDGVRQYVVDGIITESEYQTITGECYY